MRGLLLFLALLTAAVWAVARPLGIPTSDEERQSAFAGHELSVARTLAILNLTSVQQQALLPLLTDSVNEINTIRAAKAKAEANVVMAMTELHSAVLANNRVSTAVKKAASHAESPYKGIEELHDQAIPRRAASVWATLTTAQGARLRRLTHGDVGAESENARSANTAVGQPSSLATGNFGVESDANWVQHTAGKLKRAPKDPMGLLNQMYRLYGLTGEEITRAAVIGWPIMQEWALLSSQQARGQQRSYLRRLITTLPDTGILTSKLEPAMERTISDNLLSGETLHLLDPKTPEPPDDTGEAPQLAATMTDIHVLNLVNGLSLTPEQMKALIPIIEKAQVDYQAIAVQRRTFAAQSIPPQQQLRDSYLAGMPANSYAAAQLASLDFQIKALHQQETILDSRYSVQVRGVLTGNQMALVAHFVSSTVPVQSPGNLERIGEVSNTSDMENALAQLRTLPADKLSQAEANLNAQITTAFKKKKYRDAQIQAVLTLVPVVVNQARAMDDATFALKQSELAQMISVPEKQPVSGKALDERLVTYLCSPNLLPVFEKRVKGEG